MGNFAQKAKRLRNYWWRRQGKKCAICGTPIKKNTCTLDHIIPLSKGGPHTRINTQAVHGRCNQIKSDLLTVENIAKIARRKRVK